MTAPIKGLALAPVELTRLPTVSLHGPVDDGMLAMWISALAAARVGEGTLVLELSTTGGDADVGRRIADDVRLFQRQTGRRALFLGRATVYSAGATIMAGFAAPDRWLSVGTSLMIHGRKLSKCLNMDGPLRSERAKVEALLAEIDEGLVLERAGFLQLVEGSKLTIEQCELNTAGDWYLTADEALAQGLIGGIL
ncbi:MAG: peptidase S14 [Brevundimonas sp.]|nr:MAG: peptidase S14 [Brevundimonas sp.]